ncbi:ACT domain-containing protein [Candidatus Sumerlaeota bacterium]|nr:ACT domain-containing protein [Candidatus Sumerlaeota bacterium]
MKDNHAIMKAKTIKYAVSVLSEDRPGIVASVSGAISELDGNIIALSQTVVEGYFTIIVLAEFPEKVLGETLREKLVQSGKSGEYSVIVRNYAPPRLPRFLQKNAEQYILTITGADTKELVYSLSKNLTSRKININDIACYLEGEKLTLIAQLLVPHNVDINCLQDELSAIGMSQKLSIHLQHIDIFKETNRI